MIQASTFYISLSIPIFHTPTNKPSKLCCQNSHLLNSSTSLPSASTKGMLTTLFVTAQPYPLLSLCVECTDTHARGTTHILLLSFCSFLEKGSLTKPGARLVAGSPNEPFVSALHSTGVTGGHMYTLSSIVRNLNSGPCVCVTSVLT